MRGGAIFAACGLMVSAHAQTRTLRIVTCNIEADVNGATAPLPGLIAPPSNTNNVQAGGVLEGIGEEVIGNDPARPLDILALEETTSNPVTVTPIVSALNSFYGLAGMYSSSSYQATESGNFAGSGNGPNAIVYNTKTVQLLASVPVGSARQGEAQIIRNDSAALSAAARILYVGDYNTGVAAEGMYVTLIAPGINQAIDPVNPAGNTNLTWDGDSTPAAKTFSPTGIHYRDDYQMMTTNVYDDVSDGLALVPGTYHVFGNNGSISYFGAVTDSSNTALKNRLATNGPVFINASQLYTDLTYASDHLPVAADYTIPLPAPLISSFNLAGTNLMFNVANCITGGVYTVWMTTNLALPFSNWTALGTNVSNSGSFNFTVTNAVNGDALQSFYLLQTK